MRAVIVVLLTVASGLSAWANPAMEGDWMIEVRPDGAPVIGMLELERNGDEWQAFVEGGPADVTVDGDRISVGIDSRDLRGFIFFLRLEGTLEGDSMSGSYIVESDAEVPFTPGTWSAERHMPAARATEPDPFDITGIWKPAPGVDMRKYSMVLTPEAQAWHDGYLMHYDQPNVRCISPGIVAMVAWGGYPFEVLESENRLTFLYEVDSEVRRVYLDGRDAPPFYPGSGMGFSTARWEGRHLVIETTNLAPNVRDFRGEPISENARMEEVYSISEDGQRLSAVITLHDPENYERPPVRRQGVDQGPEYRNLSVRVRPGLVLSPNAQRGSP